MPIVQPIGRQRGLSLPLLLIMLFWLVGSQSLAAESERSSASETEWQITGQAGRVSVRSPGRTVSHRAWPGTRILPGSQVTTYNGSRLELASAGDRVTASGPSRFTLPDAEHNGVRVHQNAGALRYQVQSAPKRHFEVKTPHFSTVVKGTTFLVSIGRASAEVAVQEGRVAILDHNGEPLAELTAGQTGRMAAHPGATVEISTASDPSFGTATEPGAGFGSPDQGNTAAPQTTGATGSFTGAPLSEPEVATADISLLERIRAVLADIAAQISTGDAQSTEGARLGSDQGGGGREQETSNNGSSTAHGSRDDENGNGKGGGKGKGKGKGNGKGGGKGKGNGEGKGRGKGPGHDRGKGRDGSAYIHLEFIGGGHRIAWNERR